MSRIFCSLKDSLDDKGNVKEYKGTGLSIHKNDSVIVVDEAENILQSKSSFFGMQFTSPKKGIVNKMLENNVNKVIWILNYTDGLDDSTLRRFTYSIKFTVESRMAEKSRLSGLAPVLVPAPENPDGDFFR